MRRGPIRPSSERSRDGCASDWFDGETLAKSAGRHRGRGTVLLFRQLGDVAVPMAVSASGLAAFVADGYDPIRWVDRALAVLVVLEVARVPHRLLADGWSELTRKGARGTDAPSRPTQVVTFVVAFCALTMLRLVGTALVVLGAFSVARATPWWPIVLGGGLVGAMALHGLLYPVVMTPLLDGTQMHVAPRDQASHDVDELVSRIAELCSRVGVRQLPLFVVERDGESTGTYVAGLGPTRRLVVDAQLVVGPPEQLDSVVMHELGHLKLSHRGSSFALGIVAVAAGGFLLWSLEPVSQWLLGRSAGPVADGPMLPLWVVVVGTTALCAEVAAAWLSRRHERAADTFALYNLGDVSAAVGALRSELIRAEADLDPRDWDRVVALHPAPAERLARLRSIGCQRIGLRCHPSDVP